MNYVAKQIWNSTWEVQTIVGPFPSHQQALDWAIKRNRKENSPRFTWQTQLMLASDYLPEKD